MIKNKYFIVILANIFVIFFNCKNYSGKEFKDINIGKVNSRGSISDYNRIYEIKSFLTVEEKNKLDFAKFIVRNYLDLFILKKEINRYNIDYSSKLHDFVITVYYYDNSISIRENKYPKVSKILSDLKTVLENKNIKVKLYSFSLFPT